MTSPEFSNLDNASRLVSAIDDKFASGVARRGGIVREHEESLALIPASQLSHCPAASRVYVERPIPEEAGLAAAKWSLLGGYRIRVFESGRTQTDFLVSNGEVLKRQIAYSIETRDGQSLSRYLEESPNDSVTSIAVGGIERAIVDKNGIIYEVIPLQEVDELLGWLHTAIPEQ